MKRVLIMCFILVITFMIVGCREDLNVDSYKELFGAELNEKDLNVDSYKELFGAELNEKDLNVDSYKELFKINMITLTQNENQRKKIIKNETEIYTLLSMLKLQTQKFNENYLKLEKDLIQKLNGYLKIEIVAISKNDRDYSYYYISEDGILYEQINNFVRYTENYVISYSDLLKFMDE